MSQKQSRGSRVREHRAVSFKLDKQLTAYALAAAAAGTGILSAAEPAEARIISSEVNINIPLNGGVIQFDLNGDGVPDFGLSAGIYEFAGAPPMGNFSSWLRVIPAQAGNEVWGVSSDKDQCAVAVRAGLSIDKARLFAPKALIMVEAAGSYTRGRSSHCPWHGAHPPYLGLKFLINGEIHFGWARVATAERSAVLTGYAYETIPNKPITAGATKDSDTEEESVNAKPATVENLAWGSSERAPWRRKEKPTG
ncbi:MAG TPA: hypothetical protein VGG14_16975 [Candidatus Sulfotelmatobacter sp.]|jgi:hypothetical protein